MKFLLILLFPCLALADVAEPTLVAPVRKIVRTPVASCAIDAEAMKCWGPIFAYTRKDIDSIVDFAIGLEGRHLVVLSKSKDGHAMVSEDYFDKSGGGSSSSETEVFSSVNRQPIFNPSTITFKYPTTSAYCFRGTDASGAALEYCSHIFATTTIYDDQRAHDVAFNPCQPSLDVRLQVTQEYEDRTDHCVSAERPWTFPDDSLDRAFTANGFTDPAKPTGFKIAVSGTEARYCSRDGDHLQTRSTHLIANIPANSRTTKDGLLTIDEEGEGYRSWFFDRLSAEVLPETQCQKYPHEKMKLLSRHRLLAFDGSNVDLNEDFPTLAAAELGMFNIGISLDPAAVSFTNASKSASVTFPTERYNSANAPSFWQSDVTSFFLRNLAVYDQFYVYDARNYDDQLLQYRIFDKNWMELKPAKSDSGERRRFKLKGVTYSCVRLNCYQVL